MSTYTRRLIAVLIVLAAVVPCCFAATSCNAGRKIDVGGYSLWMRSQGVGSPTVVFESGGGDDSSVWSDLEPVIRERARVRTVVYDRADLGKSGSNPHPYHIEAESRALGRALAKCGIRGLIVVVSHSYGGFISEILAPKDKRIQGLVLIDANIPSFQNEKIAVNLSARYTPLAQKLIKEKARPGRSYCVRIKPIQLPHAICGMCNSLWACTSSTSPRSVAGLILPMR